MYFIISFIAKLLISQKTPCSKKEIKMALYLGGCSFVRLFVCRRDAEILQAPPDLPVQLVY